MKEPEKQCDRTKGTGARLRPAQILVLGETTGSPMFLTCHKAIKPVTA
jgi:hypothetical protein